MKWTKFSVQIAMFFVWINRCMFITVDEIFHWYFNKRANHFGTHFSRTWKHFDWGLFNAIVYSQSSHWLYQNRTLMDIENENHPIVPSPERERATDWGRELYNFMNLCMVIARKSKRYIFSIASIDALTHCCSGNAAVRLARCTSISNAFSIIEFFHC